MEKQDYLQDPCRASSLPFWKTNSIQVPANLLILREDDPCLSGLSQIRTDTPYFKLIHHMQHIDRPRLPDGFRFIAPDETALSRHITACYASERATVSELAAYRLRPTYAPDLWLAIVNEGSTEIVASAIAELDPDIQEGILEWIQVSPAYKHRGFGRLVVQEALYRLQGRADFVTVSGKENDPSNPRILYERCGFTDGVIWHVLEKV